jgi:hypothetical protein
LLKTPLDFDWGYGNGGTSYFASAKRVEDYMAVFQLCKPGETSAENDEDDGA